MLLAIAFTDTSYSQLVKGNWLIGGSGSFYSSNQTIGLTNSIQKSKETKLNISTGIGYFLTDKFAVGLIPSFSWDYLNVDNGTASSDQKKILVGPFARYYFLSDKKPFNLFAQGSYQVGKYLPGFFSGNCNTFSIVGGPVIYFNPSVGLEFTAGYSSNKQEYGEGFFETEKGFQFGIAFQIHLQSKRRELGYAH